MLCEQWLSHDSNMTKTAAVVLFPGRAVPNHTVWEQGYHWTRACKNRFQLPQWALRWTNAGQVFHPLEGITRWPYRVHFPHCDGCDGLVTNGCRLWERANHKVLQVDYKNSIEGNVLSWQPLTQADSWALCGLPDDSQVSYVQFSCSKKNNGPVGKLSGLWTNFSDHLRQRSSLRLHTIICEQSVNHISLKK